MITENDIKLELEKLNSASSKFDKVYEYHKGNGAGLFGLFSVNENVYRPVYFSKTPSGFFAYVSLLKNLYLQGKIGKS